MSRLPKNVKVVAGGAPPEVLAELPPVKDAETAMAALMHMVLKHTADVLRGVLGAVADHYGLDEDKVIAVAAEHPRVKMLVVEPALHDLGYLIRTVAESKPEFGDKPAEPVYKEVAAAPAEPAKKRGAWSEEAKATAAAKRAAKKAAAAALPPPPEPPVGVAPPSPPPRPPSPPPGAAAPAESVAPAESKKRMFKIKPKKAAGAAAGEV